jgi:ribosomal protein L1
MKAFMAQNMADSKVDTSILYAPQEAIKKAQEESQLKNENEGIDFFLRLSVDPKQGD